MNSTWFLSEEFFSLFIIPLLIFLSRICDVTIGTLRILYVSRGMKKIAPLLGFFEVLIWIIIISQIMKNLTNVLNYFAYAAGFATGNYAGMKIEERLCFGSMIIRIITKDHSESMAKSLSENKFGITVVNAKGSQGPVEIIFTVVKRKYLQKALNIIKNNDPHAFYTIEEVKYASETITFSEVNRLENLKIMGFGIKKK